MDNSFDDVPMEEDTTLYGISNSDFEGFRVRIEHWSWEGVRGNSIIFRSEDIAEISDEELIARVTKSPLHRIDSGVTLNRTESGYTFVNLNFEAD